MKQEERDIIRLAILSHTERNDEGELIIRFDKNIESIMNGITEIVDIINKKSYESGIQDLRDCQSGSWR